ncbi:MAG: ferric iron uptake transcriptional regulator [Xanthomonadales bacterium]|nr:ferric iron uptake transcriptional regulator [Xanthomonadales bacterium]
MESDRLRDVGLKVTKPRLKILELLERRRFKHMTADDIYRELNRHGDDMGLATVYRVLNQFEAVGLIIKHNFEGGQAYYEMDSGGHHDHMVCIETGKVMEFVNEEIEALQHKIAEEAGYEIEDHSLVIYVRPKRS